MSIPVNSETIYGSLDFLNLPEGQVNFLTFIKWLMRTEEGTAIVVNIFIEVGARLNGESDEGTDPFFAFIEEATRSGDPRISMVVLQLALLVRTGAELSQAQVLLQESIARLQTILPGVPDVDSMMHATQHLRT